MYSANGAVVPPSSPAATTCSIDVSSSGHGDETVKGDSFGFSHEQIGAVTTAVFAGGRGVQAMCCWMWRKARRCAMCCRPVGKVGGEGGVVVKACTDLNIFCCVFVRRNKSAGGRCRFCLCRVCGGAIQRWCCETEAATAHPRLWANRRGYLTVGGVGCGSTRFAATNRKRTQRHSCALPTRRDHSLSTRPYYCMFCITMYLGYPPPPICIFFFSGGRSSCQARNAAARSGRASGRGSHSLRPVRHARPVECRPRG